MDFTKATGLVYPSQFVVATLDIAEDCVQDLHPLVKVWKGVTPGIGQKEFDLDTLSCSLQFGVKHTHAAAPS